MTDEQKQIIAETTKKERYNAWKANEAADQAQTNADKARKHANELEANARWGEAGMAKQRLTDATDATEKSKDILKENQTPANRKAYQKALNEEKAAKDRCDEAFNYHQQAEDEAEIHLESIQ